MSCSTGKLIVPLSAGVSTANIHDGRTFDALIKSLSGIIRNILADPAYDDSKLHDSCGKKHLRLVTPIRQYPRTPPERIKLVEFYDSAIGQELHADRRTSIEPLFDTFKDTLGIRAVPVRGLCNVKSYLCADLRFGVQLAAYCMHVGAGNHPRIVKRMPCC